MAGSTVFRRRAGKTRRRFINNVARVIERGRGGEGGDPRSTFLRTCGVRVIGERANRNGRIPEPHPRLWRGKNGGGVASRHTKGEDSAVLFPAVNLRTRCVLPVAPYRGPCYDPRPRIVTRVGNGREGERGSLVRASRSGKGGKEGGSSNDRGEESSPLFFPPFLLPPPPPPLGAQMSLRSPSPRS